MNIDTFITEKIESSLCPVILDPIKIDKKIPNRATRAYLAGVFDGEGTITFTFSRKSMVLAIALGMCCRPVVSMFQNRYGGCLNSRIGTNLLHHRWIITGKRCLFFLNDLYPYLIVKKPQAQLAFEFIKTIMATGKESISIGREYRLSKEIQARRDQLLLEMRKLNNTDKKERRGRVVE